MDNKFDEYKFFTERVQHRSDRRQNTTQIYLTINTALFSIIALLIKDSGLHSWNLLITTAPLFFVGILICSVWIKTIFDFKKIIGWQYKQLRGMEKHIQGCFQLHTKEWEEFYKSKNQKRGLGFSDLELWMPIIIMSLYVLYAIGMSIAIVNGII